MWYEDVPATVMPTRSARRLDGFSMRGVRLMAVCAWRFRIVILRRGSCLFLRHILGVVFENGTDQEKELPPRWARGALMQ